jgi:hypothetical protein
MPPVRVRALGGIFISDRRAELISVLRSRETRQRLGVWLLVLGAGVALLYARYNWDVAGARFAKRGFVLSTYLFLILLPTVYYLARLTLRDRLVARLLTAVVFLITTLPYHLLGLDGSYYYRVRPQVFTIAQFPPSLEFLPGGTLRAFPFDWLFMPLLFAAGALLIWGVWWVRGRSGTLAAHRIPRLLTIAFAVICLQAFMHSSMRAPYTYLAYFQAPKAQQHWYHVYHFADGSGASEADQFAFSPLEDYFQGAARDGDNELVRRPFSFYVASQGSYFVNTFYVWLGLNCLFWLVAVVATGRLVTRLTNQRVGLIAAALTIFGPGFIAFVATPAMYMQNYAAVAVALLLFEELVVRTGARDLRRVALFTGALTLCSLVYDLTPLLFVLLAYGLARKVRTWPLIASLLVAALLTRGFPAAVTGILGIHIVPTNSEQISDALRGTRHLLFHPSLHTWYDTVVDVVPSYFRLVFQSFFVLPVVVALFGWRKLPDRAARVLIGGLLLMGFVVIAVLQIGKTQLGELPRLIYPTFPAIYLLAALAIDSGVRRLPRASMVASWVLVAAMAVLVNVDIFGYPTLYVEYFVSKPPVFLP